MVSGPSETKLAMSTSTPAGPMPPPQATQKVCQPRAMNVRRWAAALAVGLLGGILAFFAMFVSNFKDQYTNFLLITYLWVPSWAAVMLVDMFVFRRRAGPPVLLRGRAVLAWLVGLAAAVPFVDSTLWQSPLAVNLLHNTDISGYVGAVTGAAVYLVLGRR